MIKDIYVYGTTVAFDITPIDDSAAYYECFYDGSKTDKKFIVSQSNNTVRYNYLRYNNIIGSGGRENSFFGLCLVFEGEYIDKPYKLFKLFESVFKRIVQNNKIFIQNNGNFRYKGTFKDIANEVADLKNTLKYLIKNEFSNDIIGLTTNLNIPYHNKVTYYDYNDINLDDSEINQSFLQNGRVEFTNTAGTTEVISIEQFSDFKKELKAFSDFRSLFADKTSSIQNEWITNANLNKDTYRNHIAEAINQSVQELNKIQNILTVLSKNQNLDFVINLYKKYVENFNSINENRNKLNALLKIENNPLKPTDVNPGNIFTQPFDERQQKRKLFSDILKYKKIIFIIGGLIIISVLGYHLYPTTKKDTTTTTTTNNPVPPTSPAIINYGYSDNHEIDSIINLIEQFAANNDSAKVISLLDNLKSSYGTDNYMLKPSFSFQNLNDLRTKFTKVKIKTIPPRTLSKTRVRDSLNKSTKPK